MSDLIPIKEIIIKDGAIKNISEILNKLCLNSNSKIMVICDNNTYKAAARDVLNQLKRDKFLVTECILEREGLLIPDEYALSEILVNINKDIEYFIAVGSGTINDLVRFISFKTGKPYGIVATAPSMDGYASSVSPLIVKGFKRTYSAIYPGFIVGDLDVISQAPYDMITAGFGDIIGKYTSLADWYISSIITGEAYLEDISNLIKESLEKCINASKGIKSRDKQSIKELMDALITSGIAMLKFGNSRPASGAEHHLSHYLEMKEISSGKKCHLHGTKVGVMSIIISEIYHYIFSFSTGDIKKLIDKRASESRNEYIYRIKSAYGQIADEVLSDLNNFYLDEGKRTIRQNKILENWVYMKKWVKENVPEPIQIRNMMKEIDAPSEISEIGVDKALLLDILINAKDVRKRYTVLRLCEDIGFGIEKLFERIIKLKLT